MSHASFASPEFGHLIFSLSRSLILDYWSIGSVVSSSLLGGWVKRGPIVTTMRSTSQEQAVMQLFKCKERKRETKRYPWITCISIIKVTLFPLSLHHQTFFLNVTSLFALSSSSMMSLFYFSLSLSLSTEQINLNHCVWNYNNCNNKIWWCSWLWLFEFE